MQCRDWLVSVEGVGKGVCVQVWLIWSGHAHCRTSKSHLVTCKYRKPWANSTDSISKSSSVYTMCFWMAAMSTTEDYSIQQKTYWNSSLTWRNAWQQTIKLKMLFLPLLLLYYLDTQIFLHAFLDSFMSLTVGCAAHLHVNQYIHTCIHTFDRGPNITRFLKVLKENKGIKSVRLALPSALMGLICCGSCCCCWACAFCAPAVCPGPVACWAPACPVAWLL